MIDNTQLDFLGTIEPPLDALLTPDEMFEQLNEELLLRFNEDKRIERKPARFPTLGLGQYMSMWANTSPEGGIIVVGLKDNGVFEGLDGQGTSRINDLEAAHSIYCPDASCQYKRIAATNREGKSDFVLAIRVAYHPTRVVKTNKSEAFTRIGDRCHKLSADEIRELANDKKEVSFERENCGLEYPTDFDRALIRSFAARVREGKGWTDEHSEEDVLSLMRLGKMVSGRFTPNVACALLFANVPRDVAPGCRVRFLRFDGEEEGTGEKWNAVKDEMIDGVIPTLIDETAKTINAQLRTFSRLDTKGKFYAHPEYPATAWYEAIVNACVHRSYGNGLRNTPVFVKMFDDRLVIESPGPFPPFVTPSNIYDSHSPKNPFLMDSLRYMEFVKCAHEGTRRMRASMSDMNLPDPEFKQDQVGHFLVRVTLRNNVKQRKAWVDRDVADLVGSMLAKALTDKEKRLLNFVAERGEISVSDAQRLTDSTWPAAKKMLVKLAKRGILRHNVRENLDRDPQARFTLNRGET